MRASCGSHGADEETATSPPQSAASRAVQNRGCGLHRGVACTVRLDGKRWQNAEAKADQQQNGLDIRRIDKFFDELPSDDELENNSEFGDEWAVN